MPDAGFIDRYLTGVIYPEDHVWTARIVLAIVVVVSWAGFVMRWRRRRAQQRASISGQAATYR